jgi:prepilin-type N-terminal cleavage/methylation domain-containing protein
MQTKNRSYRKHLGFTLVELMIVVVIVAILAAVAMPIYSKYVRKSRTSEAVSNLGTIAMFEETYFSEADSYVTLGANPTSVPNPTAAGGGGRLQFSDAIAGWSLLGRVMPNGTRLYFQYQAFAGQRNTAGTGDNTGGTGNLQGYTTAMTLGNPPGSTCAKGMPNPTASGVGIPSTGSSNWYFITAVGDQKYTSSNNHCSVFLKVIDRPDISIYDDIE